MNNSSIAETITIKVPESEELVPMLCYEDIEQTSVDWLWFPYIPFGKLTIIQGNPGEGKTYFAMMLGSIDIMAAVRSLIFIGKVRKDPTTRVLIHEKSSLAPPGETMAFKLGDEEGFRWVGAYEISADELLDGKEGKATETKLEKGRKLIRELLADKKEISIRELDEKAKEQGISVGV